MGDANHMTNDDNRARILLVEDRPSLREMLTEFLTEKGYRIETAASVQEALTRFAEGACHLVLLDLKLPDGSGLDVLRAIRQQSSSLPVILMTAYGTIQDSVLAMKMGAVDFIQKPLDLNHLDFILQRSIEFQRLQTEVLLYREEVRRNRQLPRMISTSPVMQAVALDVQRIAATEATILLSGESGTGKELFARSIHQLSPRHRGPFVEINCAAIPETLMENELFGHVRGAYTGADSAAKGKFELAAGGTLFLDEIGEMAVGVQSKLLKALEEKKITPIGGTFAIPVDVRIVAASNRDLEAAMAEGRFRPDLYYRVAQFPVRIPPLRERPDDILPLATHFLHEAATRYARPDTVLSARARETLQMYRWPGNVRELKNMIERAVVVDDDGEIDMDDLFPGRRLPVSDPLPLDLEEVARLGLEEWGRHRLEALEKAVLDRLRGHLGNDKTRMAEFLKINPKTLTIKLKKYFPDS